MASKDDKKETADGAGTDRGPAAPETPPPQDSMAALLSSISDQVGDDLEPVATGRRGPAKAPPPPPPLPGKAAAGKADSASGASSAKPAAEQSMDALLGDISAKLNDPDLDKPPPPLPPEPPRSGDAEAAGSDRSMESLLRTISEELDDDGPPPPPPPPKPPAAPRRPPAGNPAAGKATAPPVPGDGEGLLAVRAAADPAAGTGARDLLAKRDGAGASVGDVVVPPDDERRHGLEDRRRGEPDTTRMPRQGDRRASDGDRRDGDRRDPGWDIRASAATTDDPLLGCLTILCALLDRPLSAEALTSGLPLVDGKLTTELFPRAAGRAGIAARLVGRGLGSITRISLPCVLLLKGRRACVLTELTPGQTARIVLPEMGAGAREVPYQELVEEYVGYAIFARPEFQFDSRAEDLRVKDPKGWFWGTVMSSWRLYIEVVVAAFLINAFAIASPLFVMNVYDRVVPNFAEETLWVLAVGVAIVFLFDFLLKFARTKLVDAAGKRADTRIAARLFQQVMGMKMGARPQSAGSLANSLREFDTLREFFTSSTLVTLIDLPFLFLFVGVIYLLGGPLAVIPLAAIVLVVPVVFLIQIRLQQVVAETYREAQQKHAILVEAISGVETIKSTASEGRMQRNWETFVGRTAHSGQKAHFWSQAAVLFSGYATQMVTVGIIVYGVYLIANGDLSVGALVACNILAGRAMAPLGQVAGIIIRFNQSRVSLQALDEMMKTPVERPEGRQFINKPNISGAVEFKNVSFQYPGAQTAALTDCSFKIQPGEKVGIIGRIGSGKSTIERLLLGLYEPSEGAVLVDGIDTRQLDPADLRRSVGVVPQDVYLFYGSVRENIAIGAPYTDDAAILRAARIAGVDEFVLRNPRGFDLEVAERGMNLSGGQRQAIAVARALLLDPPVLLLDEPTSSMDNTTESRFKARLGTILGGKTLILITHRGSLLSLVDRLIVMDGGRVVADGPKQDVLEALSGGRIHTARD